MSQAVPAGRDQQVNHWIRPFIIGFFEPRDSLVGIAEPRIDLGKEIRCDETLPRNVKKLLQTLLGFATPSQQCQQVRFCGQTYLLHAKLYGELILRQRVLVSTSDLQRQTVAMTTVCEARIQRDAAFEPLYGFLKSACAPVRRPSPTCFAVLPAP